jgi:DtxR family Mn-dependent transcriptional regulator
LEHAISPELADSLCTLLGHPPASPAGEPIPRGACCQVYKNGVQPVVRQLPELELGARGRITFIHPRFSQRLEQLSGFGLVPGTDIRLKQHHPSVVVDVGETTLALDTDVACDIFVKPIG